MNSNKNTARLAGLLYLIMAIIAPFGIMYVPSQIIVWGDATATAHNILAKEFLFRTGIASELIGQVLFLLVVWVLYRLLKPVNEHLAKIMCVLVFVSVPISFLGNVFNITALMILKGGILQSFEPEQVHDLVAVLLRTGSYGTQMVQLYWGLWLVPFGLLVYKSGFIPRIFGIFLVTNGIAYIILSFTFLFFPDYRTIVFQFAMPFLFLGEIPIILWLLIKGVKVKQHISDI
jgi:uncharacterized protein DUF4386